MPSDTAKQLFLEYKALLPCQTRLKHQSEKNIFIKKSMKDDKKQEIGLIVFNVH